MRFRRHSGSTAQPAPAAARRTGPAAPADDGGGQGAEYLDHGQRDDPDEDRTAWHRARHWTPEPPKG